MLISPGVMEASSRMLKILVLVVAAMLETIFIRMSPAAHSAAELTSIAGGLVRLRSRRLRCRDQSRAQLN